MGRPIYGHVFDGYWQDIGNLDQYRQANFDALDERVRLEIPGIRLRGNVWLGEGVELDDLDAIEGPAFIGNYCRIRPRRASARTRCSSPSVTVRESAASTRSVIDAATYIGQAALIEGAVVGRTCDIRAHVRVHEGGDRRRGDDRRTKAWSRPASASTRSRRSSPARTSENLIWESRARRGSSAGGRLRARQRRPDARRRQCGSRPRSGRALKRGARVVASRESPAVCRMIKRAVLSGLASTGVDVADLRVMPAAVGRHLLQDARASTPASTSA